MHVRVTRVAFMHTFLQSTQFNLWRHGRMGNSAVIGFDCLDHGVYNSVVKTSDRSRKERENVGISV